VSKDPPTFLNQSKNFIEKNVLSKNIYLCLYYIKKNAVFCSALKIIRVNYFLVEGKKVVYVQTKEKMQKKI